MYEQLFLKRAESSETAPTACSAMQLCAVRIFWGGQLGSQRACHFESLRKGALLCSTDSPTSISAVNEAKRAEMKAVLAQHAPATKAVQTVAASRPSTSAAASDVRASTQSGSSRQPQHMAQQKTVIKNEPVAVAKDESRVISPEGFGNAEAMLETLDVNSRDAEEALADGAAAAASRPSASAAVSQGRESPRQQLAIRAAKAVHVLHIVWNRVSGQRDAKIEGALCSKRLRGRRRSQGGGQKGSGCNSDSGSFKLCLCLPAPRGESHAGTSVPRSNRVLEHSKAPLRRDSK